MQRLKAFLTPTQSTTNLTNAAKEQSPISDTEFRTAKTATTLFSVTDPAIDGEECLHDCDSCTVSLPRKWEIDEEDELYGHVKGWDYHLLVATGKTDWVRDVVDEKGSLMEGIGEKGLEVVPKSSSVDDDEEEVEEEVNGKDTGSNNEIKQDGVGGGKVKGNFATMIKNKVIRREKKEKRRVMLSACDMPPFDSHHHHDDDDDDHSDEIVDDDAANAGKPKSKKTEYAKDGRTRVVLLPTWQLIENIDRKNVDWLMDEVVAGSVANTDRIRPVSAIATTTTTTQQEQKQEQVTQQTPPPSTLDSSSDATTTITHSTAQLSLSSTSQPPPLSPSSQNHNTKTNNSSNNISVPPGIKLSPLPHKAIILLCSHKTRDARCGQSAPLLRTELTRHLRSLGLYRDFSDTRPNGVGIYFINHVGGHKYSANVIVYRRQPVLDESGGEGEGQQAVQGIWLARIRPEDCENLVRYTVLQGKVVKPLRQLRGGFDRDAGLVSW